MQTSPLRKVIAALIGAAGLILYILTSPSIESGNSSLFQIPAVILDVVLLILSAGMILSGRALFGSDGHRESRNALAITLATLPIQKLLLFGLKYYVGNVSELSPNISKMFVHNTGVLQVVLALFSLGVGIFTAVTKRAVEYSDRPLGKAESSAKAGLLGMLGMAGYDICDVILTSYDGQKTAILIFESEEAWNLAVEKGYDQEILAACRSAEPDYEYRFEAKG